MKVWRRLLIFVALTLLSLGAVPCTASAWSTRNGTKPSAFGDPDTPGGAQYSLRTVSVSPSDSRGSWASRAVHYFMAASRLFYYFR